MKRKTIGNDRGQSLLEILIAIVIVTMVSLAVVSRVVESVRNANYARNQTLATRFSQEGVEWARIQRDQMGWSAFSTVLNSYPNPVTFCVLDESESLTCLPAACTGLSVGPCAGTITGTIFEREVELTYVDTSADPNVEDYVEMVVVVNWEDSIGLHDSQLSTRLSEWKKIASDPSTPVPTPTPTPTPTPIPVINIRVNDGDLPVESCDDVCTSNGEVCLSVGLNNPDFDNGRYNRRIVANLCGSDGPADCSTPMSDQGLPNCAGSGGLRPWYTYCKCQE